MKWVSKRSEFSEGTNRSRNQEDGGPRGRSDRQDMNLPTIKPEEGQKPIQEKAERCQQSNSWTKRLASCLHVPKNEDKLKNSSWINEAILLRTQLHKIKPACPWPATHVDSEGSPRSWVVTSHSSATYRLLVLELLLPILCGKVPEQPGSSAILLGPFTWQECIWYPLLAPASSATPCQELPSSSFLSIFPSFLFDSITFLQWVAATNVFKYFQMSSGGQNLPPVKNH